MSSSELHHAAALEHVRREVPGLSVQSLRTVLELLAEGATIPFIARYRKERTGGADEVQLRAIEDLYARRVALEKRRESILESLRRREVLTEELEGALGAAPDLSTLEDIYLPWRPRRRTRADRAREEGLEPLARTLLSDRTRGVTELVGAAAASLGLEEDRCLAGAGDIIAADCSVDPALRRRLRELFRRQAALESRLHKKGPRAETWRDYFQWREPARACPSHRLLAIFRGEKEDVLKVTVQPPEMATVRMVEEHLLDRLACRREDRRTLLRKVARDAAMRLLAPSLERELRQELRERAEESALRIFAANLEDLLMAPPLGARPVLALDPGFRTGSKMVALDGTGRVLDHGTIFPVPPRDDREGAERVVRTFVNRYEPRAVGVGSGTAGREVEQFLRSLELQGPGGEEIPVVRVNEAGASVYSASPLAGRELPDLDVTVRGAVSIGRRLQDPLSELVKIDPAAVGVGQYQHDISPERLQRALSQTVESCVNAIGVELNTAGPALLARVAGLAPGTAEAIVAYRDTHGAFSERSAITRVPGIGPRTAEQAVGFLRCADAPDPLENTGVHPERYALVEEIARDLRCAVADLCGNGDVIEKAQPERYVREGPDGPGLPTILDILQELRHPGRDPRKEFSVVSFREGVNSIEDLAEGMELTGIVTNVTAFGAFVDIGVHRDGLIHLSRLADRYVRDPREIVRVGQAVDVTVLAVDRERQRIDLKARVPQDHG